MYRRSFLALAFAPVLRGEGVQGLAPDKIRNIERLISSEMSRQGIPGMSVAVGMAESVVWSAGYGLADMENFVPAKAATVYRTASIAKPITAVGVMQMVERGRLDLDAPVQKYVPEFPEKKWPVTLRHVLGHLSGIRDYRGESESLNTQHFYSLREALDAFRADELVSEPGTEYRYSTLSYVLAGAAIESASGLPYARFLRESICEPAGMTHTRLDDAHDIIPNRAAGYRRTADGRLMNAHLLDTSNRAPGGGLVSTAGDLVRFALAVGSGKLLRPPSVAEMFRALETRDGKCTNYGLGWAIGKDTVSHGGGQAGVSTSLWYRTDEKVALAVMFNLQGVQHADLTREILRTVCD
jgi:CubicO group peptidase (beta-lactamase class C family)